jgi:hypothetical protein
LLLGMSLNYFIRIMKSAINSVNDEKQQKF